jgi:hypothetical protein
MNLTPASGMNRLFASAQEGIQRAVKQASVAGDQLANGEIDPQPILNLDEASILVKLNAITLRTGDEMLGTLLNLKK